MLKFSQRLLLTSYLPVVLYFDCYTLITESAVIYSNKLKTGDYYPLLRSGTGVTMTDFIFLKDIENLLLENLKSLGENLLDFNSLKYLENCLNLP